MDWISLCVGVGSAMLSGGITFGLLKGEVKALRERAERTERDVIKLEDSKASKELVGGLSQKIEELEERLDKRLDRIEALLSRGGG